jgi:hypothetical protein
LPPEAKELKAAVHAVQIKSDLASPCLTLTVLTVDYVVTVMTVRHLRCRSGLTASFYKPDDIAGTLRIHGWTSKHDTFTRV